MGNPVTQSELAAALDALLLEDSCPPLLPDDITAPRLREKTGWFHQKAMQTILRWQAAGKIEYIGERQDENGRRVKAWRMVQTTKDE